SIAQQLMALVIVALAIALATNIAIIAAWPPPQRQVSDLGRVIARMQTTLPVLRAAEPQKRQSLADRADDRTMRLEIVTTPIAEADNPLARAVRARTAAQLGVPLDAVRSNAAANAAFLRSVVNQAGPIKPAILDQAPLTNQTQLAVRLDDEHWLTARAPR